MVNRLIIRLNNLLGSIRRPRVEGDGILILAPRCLQDSECPRDVVSDIENCAGCGKCRIAELLELHREFDLRTVVANGGRKAVAAARDPKVRVIVAIACEKELAAGILTLRATKRVYAVRNIVRCEPCINTDVQVSEVRAAVEKALCHAG